MFEIRNSEDLRRQYFFLHEMENDINGRYKEFPHIGTHILALKKAIREYHKKDIFEPERRIVKDDGTNGCTILVELGWFRNAEQADRYFKMTEYIEIPNSQYDCTGKLFTAWYKVFKRDDLYYAYHRIAMDC